MDSSKAVEKLQKQIEAVDSIKQLPRFCPEWKKWYRDTEVAIEKVFGSESRHGSDFRNISFNLGVFSMGTPDSKFQSAYLDGLETSRQVLRSMIEEVQEFGSPSSGSAANGLIFVESLLVKFHRLVKQLRVRHDQRSTLEIEDEYDAQDLLHALLHLISDDIRREEWTPSYAGGSSRIDFLLKKEETLVEVKKTRKGLGAKEVGDQLLVDIGRYQAHPNCKRLVCFVYDPEGRIGNPVGLERDLTKTHGDLPVTVIVAPKGN